MGKESDKTISPFSFLNTNTCVLSGVDGRDGTAGLPGKHAQPLKDRTLCPAHFLMNTLRITPRIQVYPVNQVSICTCPLKLSIRNNLVNEYTHIHIICEYDGHTFFLPHEHLCMGWPTRFISGIPGVPGENGYGGTSTCI